MSGYDFNRNGKIDGTDYYLYEKVFSKDDSETGSASYSSSGSPDNGMVWRWMKYMVAAGYLGSWLKGGFGFGFLSVALGLVCAWVLLKPVLEWFGS